MDGQTCHYIKYLLRIKSKQNCRKWDWNFLLLCDSQGPYWCTYCVYQSTGRNIVYSSVSQYVYLKVECWLTKVNGILMIARKILPTILQNSCKKISLFTDICHNIVLSIPRKRLRKFLSVSTLMLSANMWKSYFFLYSLYCY